MDNILIPRLNTEKQTAAMNMKRVMITLAIMRNVFSYHDKTEYKLL